MTAMTISKQKLAWEKYIRAIKVGHSQRARDAYNEYMDAAVLEMKRIAGVSP